MLIDAQARNMKNPTKTQIDVTGMKKEIQYNLEKLNTKLSATKINNAATRKVDKDAIIMKTETDSKLLTPSTEEKRINNGSASESIAP